MAVSEHEFTIASENSAGANSFDPLDSLDQISNLKKEVDYLIILYHGGKEYYRFPTPYLQRVCRKIVDKGANLVVCQHSHCIGAFEDYKNSKIIYGQGNFIFDREDRINKDCSQTSLLIEICLDKNIISINYYPLRKNLRKLNLQLMMTLKRYWMILVKDQKW